MAISTFEQLIHCFISLLASRLIVDRSTADRSILNRLPAIGNHADRGTLAWHQRPHCPIDPYQGRNRASSWCPQRAVAPAPTVMNRSFADEGSR